MPFRFSFTAWDSISSLIGIALIAASGFAANAQHAGSALGKLSMWFLAGSAAGMTLGAWSKTFIPARGLNVIFGLSVLGVAAFVILQNLSLIP